MIIPNIWEKKIQTTNQIYIYMYIIVLGTQWDIHHSLISLVTNNHRGKWRVFHPVKPETNGHYIHTGGSPTMTKGQTKMRVFLPHNETYVGWHCMLNMRKNVSRSNFKKCRIIMSSSAKDTHLGPCQNSSSASAGVLQLHWKFLRWNVPSHWQSNLAMFLMMHLAFHADWIVVHCHESQLRTWKDNSPLFLFNTPWKPWF